MHHNIKDKTFLGKFAASTLNVGISPWENMKPDCIHKSALICDSGMELEYLTIAATLLNITLNYKRTNVPGCGTIDSSGNWTGLIGMLYNKEIDITGNLCSMDNLRNEVKWLRHTWPVLQHKQSFLIKASEPSFEFSIWAPFSFNVWMCIIGTVLLFVGHVILLEKLIHGKPLQSAILNSITNSVELMSCMDGPPLTCYWFLWICIVGYITTCYSNFITCAILKPVIVQSPFTNNDKLSEAMLKGEYKLMSYQNPPSIPRYINAKTGEKFKEAIKLHGYHHYHHESVYSDTQSMLNQIVVNDNIVLAQSRFLLRIYLDRFKDRQKLWLLNDKTSPWTWSCYFYRDDFPFVEQINKAIILIGDFKENLKTSYVPLSYGVVDTYSIQSVLQQKLSITMTILKGPLVCYGIGNIVSVGLFVIERVFPPKILSRICSISIKGNINRI